MKINSFADTDALCIELRAADIAETRDLDAHGGGCAITSEHASERADSPRFSHEQITS